jgi:DNA-binding IclR family transcriptional regulator
MNTFFRTMPTDTQSYTAIHDDLAPRGLHNVPVVDPGPVVPALVKSAGRALQVFEYFDEIQRDAKVQEISTRLSMPQSSTSVLLKCLVQMGYLEYDSHRRSFFPSPRVALMGTWINKGPIRNGSLMRMMEELAEKTGETVLLATRNGIYSHYIRVVQTKTSSRFHVPLDARRPATWSATGFALLCHERDELIRSLCQRTNSEAKDGQPLVQFKQVQANVQSTRRAGYFFSKELVTPGTGAIAIPLPKGIDWRDRPLAIGVSGPLNDFAGREKTIVKQMREAIGRHLVEQASAKS